LQFVRVSRDQAVRRIHAFAELEVFERQADEMAERLRSGLLRADFEALELLELRQMHGGGIGELGMRETERFEGGEVLAERPQPFVVNLAPAKAGAAQPGPAGEILERLAGHRSADVAEAFEVLEAGEVGEAEVVELGLVDDVQVGQALELRHRREPRVLRGGVDNGQHLDIGDAAKVLVESLVEGVHLALGLDVQRRAAEVDDGQRVEQRGGPAQSRL
jgi:hypothetical protein